MLICTRKCNEDILSLIYNNFISLTENDLKKISSYQEFTEYINLLTAHKCSIENALRINLIIGLKSTFFNSF